MSANTLAIIVTGEDRASGILGRIGDSLGGFGRIAGGIALAGAAALAAGGVALAGVLKDCVGEAIEAEAASAQLAAVLKSTGGAAGVTSEMANELATSLSGVTRFGDEAIMAGESMLLTFTNIGKDVFPQTTQVMLDMSQALGQDLKSSAMQLGKALNDPIGGMSALQRVGVTFTDSQKAAVEAMMKTGNIAGAQKLILAELAKEFGGSAVAAGQTFAGQMDIANNAIGNIKESVGMALLPALSSLAQTMGPVITGAAQGLADVLITKVVPAVSGAFGVFSSVFGLFSMDAEKAGAASLQFTEGLYSIGVAFGMSATDAEIFSQTVGDTVSTLGYFVTAVMDAGFQSSEAWEAMSAIIGEESATMVQTFVGDLPGAVQRLVGAWLPAWQQIEGAVSETFATIQRVISSVLGIIGGIIREHGTAIQAQFTTAWERISTIVADVLGVVRTVIATVLGAVAGFLQTHGAEIKSTLGNAWEQIGRIVNLALELIQNTVVPILRRIGEFVRDHSTQIQTVLTGAWTIIKTAIETVLGVIEGVLKAVLLAIRGDWAGAWEEVKKVAETLWEGIKGVITTAIKTILAVVGTDLDTIKRSFEEKFQAIKDFLGGIDLGAIGRQIIQGLINGIESMAGALVEKAKGVVNGAIEAAKNLLGIQSPSKVFQQMGVLSMEGLALGFEAGRPATIAALGQQVAEIVAELERLANAVLSPAAVASAKAVTDPLVAILENVAGMVEALGRLADVKVPTGVGAILVGLADVVRDVVNHYQYMADHVVAAAAVHSAKAFTDAVAVVFANVRTIVEGVNALGELTQTGIRRGTNQAIEALGLVVQELVTELSRVAKSIPDLGAAAGELARNAEPVLGIVQAAIDAFRAIMVDGFTVGDDWLFGDNSGRLLERIQGLGTFVYELVGNLGYLAEALGSDLMAAARELGESAGPVLGIVEDAITAFKAVMYNGFAMNDAWMFDSYTPMLERIQSLASFVYELVGALGFLGQALGADLMAAAKALAENAGPVLGVIDDAIGGMAAIAEGFTAPAQVDVDALANFVAAVTLALGNAAKAVSGELQGAAKALGEAASPVLRAVQEAVETLASLAEADLEQLPAAEIALGTVAGFVRTVVTKLAGIRQDLEKNVLEDAKFLADNALSAFRLLKEAIGGMEDLAKLDTASLTTLGFDAGFAWVTALADGIRSGLGDLGAVLLQVAGMFMGPSITGAPGPQGVAAGNGFGMGLATAPAATNVTVNINNPVVREEADIRRLAQAVSDIWTQQSGQYRRLGY